VEIAVNILKKAAYSNKGRGQGLVLIDELFHSTNPPDGEKSAQIFLSRLWPNMNVVSCISTHVYRLVEDADDSIQKLCCLATVNNNDNSIEYTYTLREGVCRVSSVKEVLQEAGLCGQLSIKKDN
jgi:DNA mismatch repair ATPase MutS